MIKLSKVYILSCNFKTMHEILGVYTTAEKAQEKLKEFINKNLNGSSDLSSLAICEKEVE